MGGPRHLWSGDWQRESAARADELATRRARPEAAAARPDIPPPRPGPIKAPGRRRALRERLPTSLLGSGRRLRFGLLVGALMLLTAGTAYAFTSLLVDHGGERPVAASGIGGSLTPVSQLRPWLGIDMGSSPAGGVLVLRVVPGSPAQAAGVKPGDVITQIDTQPVATPATLAAAIAGMQPRDRVDIQLQRGRTSETVHVTLAGRPDAHP